MSSVVLDSSALLAYLNAEPGADLVEPLLGNAKISTVNVAEVVGRLVAQNGSVTAIREMLDILALDMVDFDRDLAERAGELINRTRKQGLSLGDRACLALAARENLPAISADRAWAKLGIGVEIKLIR
jgi:PIN domain nuclease of toxin-antitoxin system